MNERIKEFAREAGLLAYNPEGPPTKLEKFAELIIRECCDRIRFCIQNEVDFIAEDIEKHFGVQ